MATTLCAEHLNEFYAANPRYHTTSQGQATLSDEGWQAFYGKYPACQASQASSLMDQFLRMNQFNHPEYSYQPVPGSPTLAPTQAGYRAFLGIYPNYANDPSFRDLTFQTPIGPGAENDHPILMTLSVGAVLLGVVGLAVGGYLVGKNSCDCHLIEVDDDDTIDVNEDDFINDGPTLVDR